MSQIKTLVKTLKKLLREHGLTYADIAKQLGLSEISIKRMFSRNSFSLERLDSICEMIDLDFIDLLRLYDDEQEKITSLSRTQEEEIVSDKKFLLIALCVQNTWTFQEIISYYDISEVECTSYLIRLDCLGLIQLLPNNKIRTMVALDFQWLPGGPIETFFEKSIQDDFLNSKFTDSGEQRFYLSGTLSKKSIDTLKKKMELLVNEFSEMQNDDARLPANTRHGTGLMLAIRPWESSAFLTLKRK